MIAGLSQCGKTTFTGQLLEQADSLFKRPIRKIVYCYDQCLHLCPEMHLTLNLGTSYKACLFVVFI